MTPIAVTIAGSDSSGGAGIQADIKTLSALGVYGASIITALTAQNTKGVQGVHDVPADFITQQMDSVFSDLSVDAVKIGMLGRSEAIEAVAAGLDAHALANVVLDPVMIAASGDPLLEDEAVDALIAMLVPRAMLITPNLHEAARLLETAVAEDEDDMADQAVALFELGPKAVLVKGGHGQGPESVDIYYDGDEPVRIAGRRIETPNTHGTGCTLSSAIAAGLAHGLDLLRAVGHAKAYIGEALAHADDLAIGTDHGPVHHFHAVWGKLPLFGALPEAVDDQDNEDF